MATIGELLGSGAARLRGAGSESARLDAELLLGWAIGAERTALLAHPDAPVGADAAARYDAGLLRRCDGEPVAYIRGLKEFHALAFSVDPRGLIPRPETELLVEHAEREIGRRLTAAPRPAGTPPLRIADVGTGSGAVAVALAVLLRRRLMLPEVELVATDVSADALALARENAVVHAVADAIRFVEADLLAPAVVEKRGTAADEVGAALSRPFDVLLANLPYVPSADVDLLPVAASFEPRLALDGGADGLALIRRLVAGLPDALVLDGCALLEIGFDQGQAVTDLVGGLPGAPDGAWTCRIERDLGGQPRLAVVRRFAVGTARTDGPGARGGAPPASSATDAR